MTTEIALPVSVNPATWNEDTRAALEFAGLTWTEGDTRRYAPAGVIAGFLAACNRTRLDPSTKQIYAAQIGGKWTILVGIDGMRAVAQRSGEYAGQTPIQWTADGVNWVDVWLSKDDPAAARVGVNRKGFTEPLYSSVTWAEFGKSSWKMKAHMLGIRAESHALRRAFPNDLAGLYTPEDADDAEYIEPTEDWETLIEQANDKETIAATVDRARALNELTDRIRTKALTRYGMFNREEIAMPDPSPDDDPE